MLPTIVVHAHGGFLAYWGAAALGHCHWGATPERAAQALALCDD